jgi:hypothetical protein
MAFNLSALGAYTKQSIEPLLMSAIFVAKTQDLIKSKGRILTGVKGPQAIPIFDTDAVFQLDACGYNPSGTTAFTQRTITPGKIKIEETLCPKDLEAYFTSEALKAGSTYEDFGNATFEAAYLERKNEKISAQLETAIWQGDTASSTQNLNRFDGLIKLIDAGSPVDGNVSGFTGVATITQITPSNVIAAVKGVKNAIPAALKGMTDVVIFCGYDVYDMYVDAGITANLFHYNFNDNSNYGGLKVPGTGIMLEAVHGLDGTGDMYATRMSNVIMGVDVISEPESYDLWYSKDNNEVRSRVAFKMGVNVAFTSEVVKFKSTI